MMNEEIRSIEMNIFFILAYCFFYLVYLQVKYYLMIRHFYFDLKKQVNHGQEYQ